MSSEQPPVGQRFTHIYRPRLRDLPDSPRFRRRLRAYFVHNESEFPELSSLLERELGLEFYYIRDLFDSVALDDLLDMMPLAWRSASSDRYSGLERAARFIEFLRRCVAEEGLAYRVDAKGGMHPLVDPTFEDARVAALKGLGEARYTDASKALAAGYDALTAHNPDTLAAVRGVIDAAENVFKIITNEKRIGATEIKSALPARLPASYDDRASNAARRLIDSFAGWANAAHQYRHASGEPEPSPPPVDLAVQMMAAGSDWIRWMLSLR